MLKRLFICLAALAVLCCSAQAELFWEDDDEDEILFSLLPPIPWDEKISPNEPLADHFLPDNKGYHDSSLDIAIDTFRLHDTTVMTVRVKLADPTQFRTGMAQSNEPWSQIARVSTLAQRFRAVLAINGDYFGYHSEGIVWRNGKQLRMRPVRSRDVLIMDDEGDLYILKAATREDFENFPGRVIHAFCFGPALVMGGEVCEDASKTLLNLGPEKPTQRIAIGQVGPLEYMIVATEGPENEGSVGFTIEQLASLMADLGCRVAYNLDGGSSASIVLNYEKINALTTGKVRLVSDCIWFATLVHE